MSGLRSIQDIVLLWAPGALSDAYKALAADLGEEEHVPRDWARRNRVPAHRIDSLVNAAQRRGFHEITHASVAKLIREIVEREATV